MRKGCDHEKISKEFIKKDKRKDRRLMKKMMKKDEIEDKKIMKKRS